LKIFSTAAVMMRAVRRVKFKLHDKRAALVDLGRHLGLFDTKRKHDGKVEVDISDVRDTFSSAWLASQPLKTQRAAIQAMSPEQLQKFRQQLELVEREAAAAARLNISTADGRAARVAAPGRPPEYYGR
jgi:hypothetical protein